MGRTPVPDCSILRWRAIPEITDEEREAVCQVIDKRGLWGTDLPEILGLVER